MWRWGFTKRETVSALLNMSGADLKLTSHLFKLTFGLIKIIYPLNPSIFSLTLELFTFICNLLVGLRWGEEGDLLQNYSSELWPSGQDEGLRILSRDT